MLCPSRATAIVDAGSQPQCGSATQTVLLVVSISALTFNKQSTTVHETKTTNNQWLQINSWYVKFVLLWDPATLIRFNFG